MLGSGAGAVVSHSTGMSGSRSLPRLLENREDEMIDWKMKVREDQRGVKGQCAQRRGERWCKGKRWRYETRKQEGRKIGYQGDMRMKQEEDEAGAMK